MNTFETLLDIGYTILNGFGRIVEYFSTHGIEINGQFVNLYQIIFGASIPLIIGAILVKWIVDFIT